MSPLHLSWRRRLAVLVPKMVAAAGAVVSLSAILAASFGPRSLRGFGDWVVLGSFVLLTAGTAAIYGGELRRANPWSFSRPRDRAGLPPEDELQQETETDAKVDPDVYVEQRRPRLRAMLPAFITFLVTLALGLALTQQ